MSPFRRSSHEPPPSPLHPTPPHGISTAGRPRSYVVFKFDRSDEFSSNKQPPPDAIPCHLYALTRNASLLCDGRHRHRPLLASRIPPPARHHRQATLVLGKARHRLSPESRRRRLLRFPRPHQPPHRETTHPK